MAYLELYDQYVAEIKAHLEDCLSQDSNDELMRVIYTGMQKASDDITRVLIAQSYARPFGGFVDVTAPKCVDVDTTAILDQLVENIYSLKPVVDQRYVLAILSDPEKHIMGSISKFAPLVYDAFHVVWFKDLIKVFLGKEGVDESPVCGDIFDLIPPAIDITRGRDVMSKIEFISSEVHKYISNKLDGATITGTQAGDELVQTWASALATSGSKFAKDQAYDNDIQATLIGYFADNYVFDFALAIVQRYPELTLAKWESIFQCWSNLYFKLADLLIPGCFELLGTKPIERKGAVAYALEAFQKVLDTSESE